MTTTISAQITESGAEATSSLFGPVQFGVVFINGLFTTPVTLFTTPSTINALIIDKIMLVSTSITGFVSQPTISIGTNAVTYDNIFPPSPMNLTANDTYDLFFTGAGSVVVPASTAVVLNPSVAAVATTYSFYAVLTGTYL